MKDIYIILGVVLLLLWMLFMMKINWVILWDLIVKEVAFLNVKILVKQKKKKPKAKNKSQKMK